MEEPLNNPTSRRRFLKKAGQAALGSALASAATPHAAVAAAANNAALPGKRQNAISKKLGEIKAQPTGPPKSAFNLMRRMPGWRPDTKEVQGQGDEYYFEEEAILKYEKKGPDGNKKEVFRRFPPPNNFPEPNPDTPDTRVAFDEPTTGKPEDWLTFNSWILGSAIKGTTDFDCFLSQIADRVRVYNAALYWLRRLHFHENAPADSDPLPHNRYGDKKKDLPDLTQDSGREEFINLVQKAEGNWIQAVDFLNKMFEEDGLPFKNIKPDMIEVNGYIVSMRIVCEPSSAKEGNPRTREVSGSSSSHISISSAFSSH